MILSHEIAFSALFILVIGCYAYTYHKTRWLADKIHELLTNHIAHLQDRVRTLEEHEKR